MPRRRMTDDSDKEPLLVAHLADMAKANLAPGTINDRRAAVLRVARWLEKSVADATRDDLKRWQEGHACLKPSSMHTQIAHLSKYHEWLRRTERRADDPTVALIRPRNAWRKLPRPISDAKLRQAMADASEPIRTWLCLAAYCGLRCCEIARLRMEDVTEYPRPAVRVLGKGNKERMIPAPSWLVPQLVALPATPDGYLFGRPDGAPGPTSAHRVSERINRFLHSRGITDTAHSLRHRFGTAFFAATHDILETAQVMGHASTDTTSGYVKLAVSDSASAAVEAISRLAR